MSVSPQNLNQNSNNSCRGPIHAFTGTELNCKGWHQEAALRMLMNNLDPNVAEKPDELIVYGGTGKAARNWECYDRIVATLKRLENDETLLPDLALIHQQRDAGGGEAFGKRRNLENGGWRIRRFVFDVGRAKSLGINQLAFANHSHRATTHVRLGPIREQRIDADSVFVGEGGCRDQQRSEQKQSADDRQRAASRVH